ncbi:hypothetical protein [Nonomuraea dietziae]|uniref:metallophosphoesterase family protein n=1 Tax=Nonomuraea dietziae TaxID=65515 RepID=UPI0031E041A5
MPTPALPDLRQRRPARLWGDYLRPGLHVLDGQTVELGGLRFGFVGGGPAHAEYRTPYEYQRPRSSPPRWRRSARWTCVCCHIPPAVTELLYDVVARRYERGSEATLAAIRRTSRATRCSATSTSRSTPARGSAGPSA